MTEAISASGPELQGIRAQHLDSLSEPQEFFCEQLSRSAHGWLLRDAGVDVGYALTTDRSTLLEFHVVKSYGSSHSVLFDQFIKSHGIRRVLCKTFDAQLLDLCTVHEMPERTVAYLFRTLIDHAFVVRPEIGARLARASDMAAITAINDGFFSAEREVLGYAEARRLFLYEDGAGLIGCGLVQPVIPGRTGHDIGMLVNPSRRRQGYGEYIVRHLKAHCLSNGYRPICGCAADNVPSRTCLEAAGFGSDHKLLEFTF